MRVFLDANILFSAAKTDGAVRALLRMLVDGRHECCANDYVVFEARRNLQAKGPAALGALDDVLAKVKITAGIDLGAGREVVQWLPEKDRPVLAAAIRQRCDVLLTGDRRHFGGGCGRTFAGVTVHSPRSLAELLLR